MKTTNTALQCNVISDIPTEVISIDDRVISAITYDSPPGQHRSVSFEDGDESANNDFKRCQSPRRPVLILNPKTQFRSQTSAPRMRGPEVESDSKLRNFSRNRVPRISNFWGIRTIRARTGRFKVLFTIGACSPNVSIRTRKDMLDMIDMASK